MCLGVPGELIEIQPDPLGMHMGKVDFGGIRKQVCLAYVPEAEVGDYVLVHVGFALSRVDEDEAKRVFAWLKAEGALDEELAPDKLAPDT